MPKIICASVECRFNNDKNECTAKTVLLGAGNILTVWEGRKDVWNCQQFELSEESKRLLESFEALAKNLRREKNDS